MFEDILLIVQNLGMPIALVLFFVYTSHQREQRLEGRISALEEFQRKVLVDTVRSNTESNRNNTVAINDLKVAVDHLDHSLTALHEKVKS